MEKYEQHPQTHEHELLLHLIGCKNVDADDLQIKLNQHCISSLQEWQNDRYYILRDPFILENELKSVFDRQQNHNSEQEFKFDIDIRKFEFALIKIKITTKTKGCPQKLDVIYCGNEEKNESDSSFIGYVFDGCSIPGTEKPVGFGVISLYLYLKHYQEYGNKFRSFFIKGSTKKNDIDPRHECFLTPLIFINCYFLLLSLHKICNNLIYVSLLIRQKQGSICEQKVIHILRKYFGVMKIEFLCR
ncbi:hypothetical protein RFI_32718 [Reticulomyxa filosa]|uniref:Uncharacterized protein n=1 Tax=Reticulomyxa filosa TaxID=46433 RepID=X6LRY9_RETFI|nr:hypothetical protein RFI_32718 [Reticulomyxa filosa]|eukprot:ETO04673.1 hypothetical protein RFI_32718 [Reticulomyxa filosa]